VRSDPTATADTLVYLAYARKDGSSAAMRLQDALEQCGIPTWRDRRDVNPVADYTAELESAIHRSSHVLVCVTPDMGAITVFSPALITRIPQAGRA
jgi:hypothetical protein